MLSELGKAEKAQIEAVNTEARKLQEARSQAREVTEANEKVAEASEVPRKGIETGTRVLQPDMELIKTQSLEAVKRCNLEKVQTSATEYTEFRNLTEEELQHLRENTHLSKTAIESIHARVENDYYLKCRNEELAGQNHEVTKVKYVEKTISVDDVKITGVFPEFQSTFECEISEGLWKQGDAKIFTECTKQLKDYLETHPEVKPIFSEQQWEQIQNNSPYIKGYTWHHSEIPGKMQLVDAKTHALSGHTGGNSIWCGGIRQGGIG